MTKILCISDTHGKHNQIPLEWLEEADIIIHSGDISNVGGLREIENFCEWFSSLSQYKHKIFIAGNHDFGFEKDPIDTTRIVREYPNIVYLEDSMVEVEGLKIYGSPWQPEFFNWAFNLERGSEILEKWNMIPLDTDILITHGPAYGECDWVVPRKKHGGEHVKFTDGGCVGCEDLLDVILNKVCPKFHISGHVHSAHGESFKGNTHFINASTLNERYEVQYQPIIFET
jgi:Icc-related predicted phosphoesterase